ncbi:MAG TPA: SAM-dependent methyltransferase, partial [Thermomonospora sp.]|nr:SAM-dependent methyltransferase [Thermomonospora sp.]
SDVAAEATAEAARLFGLECPTPLVPRSREQVARFFGDLTPVGPGLVFTGEWHPVIGGHPPEHTLMYAGVGSCVQVPDLPPGPDGVAGLPYPLRSVRPR